VFAEAYAGRMFWLMWKRFFGSYCALSLSEAPHGGGADAATAAGDDGDPIREAHDVLLAAKHGRPPPRASGDPSRTVV